MTEQTPSLTIALAGQPNVGKSTVYNFLTGGSQYVSNWPGKTCNCQVGYFNFEGETICLVDLPGTYSLSSNSLDEQTARELIIESHPDVVLVILDAVSLERNLYLVAELLSLPIPLVLGLNRMDLAESEGIHIQPEVLEAALRVPVVPLVAQRGKGVNAAIAIAAETARHADTWKPNRPFIREDHQDVLQKVEALIDNCAPEGYPSDWVALKLLEGDAVITEMVKSQLGEDWEAVHDLLAQHDDAFLAVAGGRYDWIQRMVRAAVVRPKSGGITVTDRIDRVATHPLFGVLMLIAVMAALFGFTFGVGLPLQEWLEEGLKTFGFHVATLLVGWPGWLVNLITHGVIGGVGTVLTLLPILVLFFFGMGVLEDSGYIARAAFVMDRWMHPLGLHGKSFLPFSFSVGCNVPAVMESRVIEEPSARLLTILLTPFVPCFPRLSVVVLLAPIFFGHRAFMFSMIIFSMPLLILVLYGKVFHEVFQKGKHNAFIMELPLYQAPQFNAILKGISQRVLDFIQGAATIILIVSVLLWALSYFPGGQIETSYLAIVGRLLDPFSRLIGLDWRMTVALITSMLRSENTLSTLSVLFNVGPEQSLSDALVGHLVPASGMAFLAMQLLFVPCVATIAAIKNESKSWGWTLVYVGLRFFTAIIVGIMIYRVALLFDLGM